MGVDLKLLPFDADSGIHFSHTVLSCERRRELWDAIEPIEQRVGRDVPDEFTTYLGRDTDGESAYGKTIRTPYGENLKYVLASDLLELAAHKGVTDNEKNQAIWAYLSKLRPDTKVALHWD